MPTAAVRGNDSPEYGTGLSDLPQRVLPGRRWYAVDASPGGIIAFVADWQLTKRKQEKGPAPLTARSTPQMPAVRAFSRVCDRGRSDALSQLTEPI